jgi:glycosyltransferase involved in cell wall biosynthesis
VSDRGAASGRDGAVLLIAYHYPPCVGSSGLQRTLAFSRYLPKQGWSPVVLTCTDGAYEKTSSAQLQDIPAEARVVRAWARDASQMLRVAGRYPFAATLPDRWLSWFPHAVWSGVRAARRYGVSCIWSTYPIATAHLIGAAIARITGLPWVADFRDPMVELDADTGEHFPREPRLRRARLRVESKVVARAARLVFCTETARRICLERYPQLSPDRTVVIQNGYNEELFAEVTGAASAATDAAAVKLVHSGTIYPGRDRGPDALFAAIRALAERGAIRPGSFTLVLRATGCDDHLRKLIEQTNIADFVQLAPAIPYREALAEMLQTTASLVLQGSTSNAAVPAKLYEYLRAGRPILALTDSAGETAATLERVGGAYLAALDDPAAIGERLHELLRDISAGAARVPDAAVVRTFERSEQAAVLAEQLRAVARAPAVP